MNNGQILATIFLVGLVLSYVIATMQERAERRALQDRIRRALDLPPPPRIEDPTAPQITYAQVADWLPTDIRRTIERNLR